jgi:uracil-DNA glycosylase
MLRCRGTRDRREWETMKRIPDNSGATAGIAEYSGLVAARKACRICVERSPGKIRSCGEFDFDPDVASHWELWLGHKRPKLLAVGQDFGNIDYFVRNRGRDERHNKTNDNLRKLLSEAGFIVTDPPACDHVAPVFLTNSILCIKEGMMNSAVRSSWVNACADKHLRPLVRYLKPPVVVGMGNCGWQAVRRVFALEEAPKHISNAAGSYWIAADQTRVFAVGHPGPLGLTNRSWPQQIADWRRIGEAVSILTAREAEMDRLSSPE